MGKLRCSNNIEDEMQDWVALDFYSVSAGLNTVIGVTSDGRILLKKMNEDKRPLCDMKPMFLTVPSQSDLLWQGSPGSIRYLQVAVSKLSGHYAWVQIDQGGQLHLKTSDIFRKVLPNSMSTSGSSEFVDECPGIALSDALFVLEKNGHVSLFDNDPIRTDGNYRDISRWSDVVRLVTGLQNSVFGITSKGNVLCTGWNCIKGPHGDIRDMMRSLTNVTDICTTGSECETILVTKDDGTVLNPGTGEVLYNNAYIPRGVNRGQILDSHFNHHAYVLTDEKKLISLFGDGIDPQVNQWQNVSSFAIGNRGYLDPFILAICEQG